MPLPILSADDLNLPGYGMSNREKRANTTIEEAERFEWILSTNE